jgi:hypothetical protein
MAEGISYLLSNVLQLLLGIGVLVAIRVRLGRSEWATICAWGIGAGIPFDVAWVAIAAIRAVNPDFAWYESKLLTAGVLPIVRGLNGAGWLLIILGVLSVGPRALSPDPQIVARSRQTDRPLWVHGLLFFVTFGIYWYVWLYRLVRRLREGEPGTLTFTPGQAVGFMFIPLFNIYWIFNVGIRVAQAVSEVEQRVGDEQANSRYSSTGATLLWLYMLITNLLSSADRYVLAFQGSLTWDDPQQVGQMVQSGVHCTALLVAFSLYAQSALNRIMRAEATGAPAPYPED